MELAKAGWRALHLPGSCAARAKTSAGGTATEAAEYTGKSGATECAGSCDSTKSMDIVDAGCAEVEWESEDLS